MSILNNFVNLYQGIEQCYFQVILEIRKYFILFKIKILFGFCYRKESEMIKYQIIGQNEIEGIPNYQRISQII